MSVQLDEKELLALEKFYETHPQYTKCEASTNQLVTILNGDECNLQNLEEICERANLAKTEKKPEKTQLDFENYARNFKLSLCEANKSRYFEDPPQQGGYVPAEPSQLEIWHQEAMQRHREFLLDPRTTPEDLRAVARAERQQAEQESRLSEFDESLRLGYERDILKLNKPPLPKMFRGAPLTNVELRKMGKEDLKFLVSKYGASQCTARLYLRKSVGNYIFPGEVE